MDSLQRLKIAAAMLGVGFDSARPRAPRHRCTACGCEIPPGKAGRMCHECRTVGPPQFATLSTGQRLPIKRGEVVKVGDLLCIEDGQLVVAQHSSKKLAVQWEGDTMTIDAGQL